MTQTGGALPSLIVIGTMKCGTSALHRLLGTHPDVAMSSPKELNFFNGPADRPDSCPDQWWREGQWHRGLEWYADQFDAGARARGEASPAYTSPDFPEAASRMAEVVPELRLLYLVRDPFDRAVSHYLHHHREGSEQRRIEVALLDPASHYLLRSRYLERLAPYLEVFARDQILVLVQERLRAQPQQVMQTVFAHVGVEPARARPPGPLAPSPRGTAAACRLSTELRSDFWAQVSEDTQAFRSFLGDPLPEWSSA